MLIKQILLGCLAILNPAFADNELRTVEPNMDGLYKVDFDSIQSYRRRKDLCEDLFDSVGDQGRQGRRNCRGLIKELMDDSVRFKVSYIDDEDYKFMCNSETCPREQYSKRKLMGQLKEGPN